MSRKNHKTVNGQLLQMDKRFSNLKRAQQEKISEWFYQAYRRVYLENKALPTPRQEDDIYFEVIEKINDVGIWTPCYQKC